MFWWNYVVFVVFFRFAADLVGRAFRAARWLRSKQSPSCCAINFLWIWLAEGLIESLSWAEQAYDLILLSSVLGVRQWWWCPLILHKMNVTHIYKNCLMKIIQLVIFFNESVCKLGEFIQNMSIKSLILKKIKNKSAKRGLNEIANEMNMFITLNFWRT